MQSVRRGCATVRGRVKDDRRPVRRPEQLRRWLDEPRGELKATRQMNRSNSGRGTGRRARPTAHELARYEALFAERTRGMKSSAMREMMALTERPEVISLAGGLPETTHVRAGAFAKLMSKVAAESTARALQYGPTEGMAATVECIAQVMAAEEPSIDLG